MKYSVRLITTLVFILFVTPSLFPQTGRKLPQFLFESFSKGIVKMKAGNSLSAVLNYNMVDEEMIFEQRGAYLMLDKPQDIDTVFIQNRIFVPVEKGFYEVISLGAVTIFMQHKAKYTEAPRTTAYGMTSQTLAPINVTGVKQGPLYRSLDVPENVTVSMTPMNWVTSGGELRKFNNTGQFLKIFPEKEAELKKYIRDNKLDLRSREDLVKLGTYCNEIMK